ncbi:hypothetical protein Sked_12400 [Sanguibacter keddieii DSM 10542]|uniref:Uncharacterized protein n=1 Tax=Sanguibacter keddieii (strain ATCC 51767 / DSM 10542 / NCFB 3025 / ST-74) TaxID=446469 RepID=D1BEA4_SANKS|nr:hypothetical protein Sked_12400 [Sanguibacter keddieii DSM 10542]
MSARCAVIAGTPMLAATSRSMPSGTGTTRSTGSTVSSWAVPVGRRCAARYSHTRSPTASPVTPSPRASTTPAPSWFGTTSGKARSPSARAFQSVGFTPDTTTRTRTSPGPGSATSRSTSCRTDEGPVLEYAIAFMLATRSDGGVVFPRVAMDASLTSRRVAEECAEGGATWVICPRCCRQGAVRWPAADASRCKLELSLVR